MNDSHSVMALGCIFLLLLAGLACNSERDTYEGKTASEWASMLSDKSTNTRERARKALVAIGEESVPVVVELFRQEVTDPSFWVIQNEKESIATLAELGPVAVPALISLLEDKEPVVAGIAASILGDIGMNAAPAISPLTEVLRQPDADAYVKTHAARALANMGPQAHAAVPHLTALLNEPDMDLALAVAETLAEMEQTEVLVPALTQMLETYSAPNIVPDIRAVNTDKIATALGRLGEDAESALPSLEKLLEDKDGRVQDSARRAIAAIARR